MKEIKFYKVNEPFGFFSNFSPHSIFIDKEIWPTVEHYFQSQKFENSDLKAMIRLLDSPMKAALEGRNRSNKIIKDWEIVKNEVMSRALLAKFTQHPDLRKKLLETGDAVIIEHTPNDKYWADGGDGSGKNQLGVLLMQIRDFQKEVSTNKELVLPPWIAFPDVDRHDLFWRMGLGENYLTQWIEFYNATNQEFYNKIFPEIENWEGFYDE